MADNAACSYPNAKRYAVYYIFFATTLSATDCACNMYADMNVGFRDI